MIKTLSFKVALLVLLSAAMLSIANAATIPFQFSASLQTGALAGTSFTGTGSYDGQGLTDVGAEYPFLKSLNFSVGGSAFTLADLSQGGQAFLQDGVMTYFTAAFFPLPPSTVNDIAFGFGGPGIIGYSVPPGFNFGSGVFTVQAVITPEPSSLALCATALILLSLVASTLSRSNRRHNEFLPY